MKGRQIKYNDSTELVFDIPMTWDVLDISKIYVTVKTLNGTLLSDGEAEFYTPTVLDADMPKYSIQAVLDDDADVMIPGDRIRFGAVGEIAEVREVVSFDELTHTVVFSPETEYAHAENSTVMGMTVRYTLDTTDTDVYTKGLDVVVRWVPDSSDLGYSEQCRIGVIQSKHTSIWEEFQGLYPTEWASLQNRDLVRFEKNVSEFIKIKLAKRGMDWDLLQDDALVRFGMMRAARLLFLEGSGDRDEKEYERARKWFYEWIDDISGLSIWVDSNHNELMDDNEKNTHGFVERSRYF